MRRAIAFFTCIILSLIGISSHAAATDWGAFSLRLSEEMTEQQVMNALGHQPNMTTVETCGTRSVRGAWQCRVLTFGDRHSNLTVLERRSNEVWIVNSWSVFPQF